MGRDKSSGRQDALYTSQTPKHRYLIKPRVHGFREVDPALPTIPKSLFQPLDLNFMVEYPVILRDIQVIFCHSDQCFSFRVFT